MSKCLNPQIAWICGTKVSKYGVVSPRLVFSPNEAMSYYTGIGCLSLMQRNEVSVPCGKCWHCAMRKRKDMSVRLTHEASCHSDSCFITLTYDDDHVPTTCWRKFKDSEKMFDRGVGTLPELTLMPRDVQGFVKRLRAHLKYHYGIDGLRYFAVGEYGGRTHRPHYHIMIFGWKPTDLKLFKMHNNNPVYLSSLIAKKWKYGFVSVSDVNAAVAKYAARYVTKKFARGIKDEDYLVPEFTLQSVRNGGIGSTWFDRYGADACRRGFCTLRCSNSLITKHSIPKYYMDRLRKKNLPLWLELRDERIDFVRSGKLKAFSWNDLLREFEVNTYKFEDELSREFF